MTNEQFSSSVDGRKHLDIFLTDSVANVNTRLAYGIALGRFLDFCEHQKISIGELTSQEVTNYVDTYPGSRSTRRQHLSAIRKYFSWLQECGLATSNPANGVKLAKETNHRTQKVMPTAQQARQLLDSIGTTHAVGLRDRALVGLLIFSLAKISAALQLRLGDYFEKDGVWYLRFFERGHEKLVPVHHQQKIYLDEYIGVLGEGLEHDAFLFRSSNRSRNRDQLLEQSMTRKGALKMIKRRVRDACLPEKIDCESLRILGVREYVRGGGDIRVAARIAGYGSIGALLQQLGVESTLEEGDIERIQI